MVCGYTQVLRRARNRDAALVCLKVSEDPIVHIPILPGFDRSDVYGVPRLCGLNGHRMGTQRFGEFEGFAAVVAVGGRLKVNCFTDGALKQPFTAFTAKGLGAKDLGAAFRAFLCASLSHAVTPVRSTLAILPSPRRKCNAFGLKAPRVG